jgi:hypothetical protein
MGEYTRETCHYNDDYNFYSQTRNLKYDPSTIIYQLYFIKPIYLYFVRHVFSLQNYLKLNANEIHL